MITFNPDTTSSQNIYNAKTSRSRGILEIQLTSLVPSGREGPDILKRGVSTSG